MSFIVCVMHNSHADGVAPTAERAFFDTIAEVLEYLQDVSYRGATVTITVESMTELAS